MSYITKENLIGKGSFGNVYNVKNKYALKIVPYPACPIIKARILREIDILQTLKGVEGIVGFKEVKYTDDGFMLRLELFKGPLRYAITSLTDTECLNFAVQLCNAVDHCHEANICHRDINPTNILISDNRLVLSDFGAAKKLAGWRNTAIVGTQQYIAPEQITCPYTDKFLRVESYYDQRCDLWALGCVLYEMDQCEPKFPASPDEWIGQYHILQKYVEEEPISMTDSVLLQASKMLIRKSPRNRVLPNNIAIFLAETYNSLKQEIKLDVTSETDAISSEGNQSDMSSQRKQQNQQRNKESVAVIQSPCRKKQCQTHADGDTKTL